jgi:hypothetical protein
LQPPQEDDDELIVWPSDPLERKPQADISLLTSALSQLGQVGVSLPNTSRSKSIPHPLQWYSNMGI